MNKTVHFDLETIDDVAKLLLENFKTKTVLFYGDMGVGKTTLINALLKALGGTEKATSPTFSIVNEYKIKDDIVYHFDFYRIKNLAEVTELGIEDYFYSNSFCFIEWPEVVSNIIPPQFMEIRIEVGEGESRNYKLAYYGGY